MRILHVSDLHLRQQCLDWALTESRNHDLLVIAGDLLNFHLPCPAPKQAEQIKAWAAAIQTPTIVCSGNHDLWPKNPLVTKDTKADGQWLRLLKTNKNIIATDGDTISLNGTTIKANGWLKLPDPKPCDILVTHAPPSECDCSASDTGPDFGDQDLWHVIGGNMPALILSGHIHHPRKHACQIRTLAGSLTILNPGMNTSAPIPNHWAINTTSKKALHYPSGAIVNWR
ncbi:metallophosphoesterase [Termitidicoccus mucosus]|uniref:Calcineurin-like phosphoesterase domain-containing protein n=1 Tax=Termitidicoccus mucosus TaxID=1184151 RepID=A0A178IPI2_9BACT|nr:hypothetical protein AW736_01825 [Opitutaceae bacterium TSB47]